MFNSAKDPYIKLYSNIFRPMKSGMNPPHDMKGFDWGGQVFALVGVSGHPEDDNRVLVHVPVVGQAGAIQYSQELSDAVINTETMRSAISKQKLRFDDKVEYDNKKYYIKNLSYKGAVLAYTENVIGKDKQGKEMSKTIEKIINVTEPSDIANIRITTTSATNREPGLNDYYSPDWVFETLGVVPVEDPNLILRPDKDAISSFNSKVTERQQSVMSLFGRYPWLLPLTIYSFAIAICLAIIFYAVTQDTSQVTNTATAAIQHIAGMSTSGTALPKPTTG